MQICEQVNDIELKIETDVKNANELSQRGVMQPDVVVSGIESHFTQLVNICKSKIITLETEKSEIEESLQPKKNLITDSEKEILNEWNKVPRLISSRAEGEYAINSYLAEYKFKKKDLVLLFLYICEFSFGYHIMKNVVFIDDTISNQITSILIAVFVLFVGIAAKFFPDATLEVQVFNLFKRIYKWITAISMICFIVLLVLLRDSSNSIDFNTENLNMIGYNWQDLIFNISMLFSLIFGGSLWAIWDKCYPKKLLKKRRDEGVELIEWFSSSHFLYKKACKDYEEAMKKLENEIKPTIFELKEQISKYDDNYLISIKRKALSNFLMGTYTVPLTKDKEKARKRTEEIINTLN